MLSSMDPQRLQSLQEALIRAVGEYLPKVMLALAFVVVGSLASRWVGRTFERSLRKYELEPPVQLLLVRLVKLITFALFILLAMTNLKIELGPLLAGLGVAGVGVGLALQGVLQNLFAGLLIIVNKPYRVGEYIELLGVQGEVACIELFSTTLRHPDRSRVVIPNRKVIGEVLHNYGSIRQLDLVVGVGYDTDLNQALALVDVVVRANSRVLKDPAPAVGVAKLGDSAIELAVKPWTKVGDYGAASSELYRALVEALRQKNINIPFPQREVRVVQGGTGGVAA